MGGMPAFQTIKDLMQRKTRFSQNKSDMSRKKFRRRGGGGGTYILDVFFSLHIIIIDIFANSMILCAVNRMKINKSIIK